MTSSEGADPQVGDVVEGVEGLADLPAAAEALGVEDVLERHVRWLEEAAEGLPAPAQVALRGLPNLGCRSVADFVSQPALLKWFAKTGGERALTRWLLDALTSAAEARAQDPEAASAVARARSSRASALALRPAMDRRELERWAATAGVEAWLEASAEVLRRPPWRARLPPGYWTVERVVTARTRGDDRHDWGSMPLETQEAAIALLEQQAEEVLEGLAEEETGQGPAAPEAGDPLRSVWDRLQKLRGRVRGRVSPRPSAAEGAFELDFAPDPARFVYAEEGEAWCAEGRPPRVRITLGGPRRGGDRVECACGTRRSGRCQFALSALDRALALVSPGAEAEAEDQALADRVRAEIQVPEWVRTLEAVDGALAKHAPEAPEVRGHAAELGWRIGAGPRHLKLVPVLCRPKLRGDGWVTKAVDPVDVLTHGWAARPGDEAALRLLAPGVGTRGYAEPPARGAIHQAVAQLVGHPRVFDASGGLLQVERGRLGLIGAPAADQVRLEVDLGERRLRVEDALVALRAEAAGGLWVGLEAEAGRCLVVAVDAVVPELLEILEERGDRLPREALPALLARARRLARAAPLALEGELQGRELPALGRPVFRLSLDAEGLEVRGLIRVLEGAPPQEAGAGAAVIYAVEGTEVVHARRALSEERARLGASAARAGLPAADGPLTWVVADLDRALDAVAALEQDAEVEVEWSRAKQRVTRPATTSDLRVQVRKRRNWFGLAGELALEDGTTVSLAALLAAIRGGRRWVRVEGSTWVRLSQALVSELGETAAAVASDADEGEAGALSLAGAEAVARLEGAGANVEAPTRFVELLSAMREAAALEPELPEGLVAELRPYQRAGFEWMARIAHWGGGCVLADDMGLGKTVQALAILARRAALGPALVVAPTSLGFNWAREAERFTPGLSVRLFRGRAQLEMLAEGGLGAGDVVVTSYDLAARYLERLHSAPESGRGWATLVLDEAQAIKNPETRRAQAIHELEADFRVALTGTPVENRTGELWSLFRGVLPGLLGSRASFRERFATPIERDGDAARRADLATLIRPFVLRRLKSAVATELPERTDVLLDVTLSPGERRLYERVRTAALAELTTPAEERAQSADKGSEGQRRIRILAALTRLRQAACHPRLLDPQQPIEVSAKLESLLELVRTLADEGHRALIFSQFTRFLALVREALSAEGLTACYLDGSTPADKRREEVDAFQAGEGDVFLLSLKAGGTGLNLTAADYVVHLDPWWNPAVEDQATDRAHRIGQTRPVTVYRLVARHTVEETIYQMHADKRELADALLAGTASAAALTSEDLLELLAVGATAD